MFHMFFILLHVLCVIAGGDWGQSGPQPSERWSAAPCQHAPARG